MNPTRQDILGTKYALTNYEGWKLVVRYKEKSITKIKLINLNEYIKIITPNEDIEKTPLICLDGSVPLDRFEHKLKKLSKISIPSREDHPIGQSQKKEHLSKKFKIIPHEGNYYISFVMKNPWGVKTALTAILGLGLTTLGIVTSVAAPQVGIPLTIKVGTIFFGTITTATGLKTLLYGANTPEKKFSVIECAKEAAVGAAEGAGGGAVTLIGGPIISSVLPRVVSSAAPYLGSAITHGFATTTHAAIGKKLNNQEFTPTDAATHFAVGAMSYGLSRAAGEKMSEVVEKIAYNPTISSAIVGGTGGGAGALANHVLYQKIKGKKINYRELSYGVAMGIFLGALAGAVHAETRKYIPQNSKSPERLKLEDDVFKRLCKEKVVKNDENVIEIRKAIRALVEKLSDKSLEIMKSLEPDQLKQILDTLETSQLKETPQSKNEKTSREETRGEKESNPVDSKQQKILHILAEKEALLNSETAKLFGSKVKAYIKSGYKIYIKGESKNIEPLDYDEAMKALGEGKILEAVKGKNKDSFGFLESQNHDFYIQLNTSRMVAGVEAIDAILEEISRKGCSQENLSKLKLYAGIVRDSHYNLTVLTHSEHIRKCISKGYTIRLKGESGVTYIINGTKKGVGSELSYEETMSALDQGLGVKIRHHNSIEADPFKQISYCQIEAQEKAINQIEPVEPIESETQTSTIVNISTASSPSPTPIQLKFLPPKIDQSQPQFDETFDQFVTTSASLSQLAASSSRSRKFTPVSLNKRLIDQAENYHNRSSNASYEEKEKEDKTTPISFLNYPYSPSDDSENNLHMTAREHRERIKEKEADKTHSINFSDARENNPYMIAREQRKKLKETAREIKKKIREKEAETTMNDSSSASYDNGNDSSITSSNRRRHDEREKEKEADETPRSFLNYPYSPYDNRENTSYIPSSNQRRQDEREKEKEVDEAPRSFLNYPSRTYNNSENNPYTPSSSQNRDDERKKVTETSERRQPSRIRRRYMGQKMIPEITLDNVSQKQTSYEKALESINKKIKSCSKKNQEGLEVRRIEIREKLEKLKQLKKQLLA